MKTMRYWSGTARRLFFAFAFLVCIFALASYFALAGFAEIHRGLHKMKEHEEGVRLALELSSAVRDQYAHQAHTIIIGDASHLGFYAEAKQRVLDLTKLVRQRLEEPEESAWIDDIERASAELDQIFRERIVPAVLKGERADVQAEHARAQELVSLIQERTAQLAERFEKSISDFQSHVSAVEHATFRWTLFFLLGAPVFAAGVGLYIGRSIARPVARLHEGAARLAQGDLSTRIEINTPDEFGALARQFNAMTTALKEHQEKLVQSEKLAGIGRLAAGVAHEINNPLGVILGYTRILQKRADGALAEDLKVIEDETLRCQEIVEGLLDLSRPLKALAQPLDLREACEEVAARLRSSKQHEGVRISVGGSGTAESHSQKLRQVLLNLIKNAAEAAGAGGAVEVSVLEVGAEVAVAVGDTGPGIDPAARARLFEPFFTTKPTGTGLGLAVSLAIARAHGGEIEVGSSPAGGALFTLRLPRFAQGSL